MASDSTGVSQYYLGSDSKFVYFLADSGIVKVKTSGSGVVAGLFVFLTFVVLFAGAIYGDLGLTSALFSAVFILTMPLLEESRYRRFGSLMNLSLGDIIRQSISQSFAKIDWASIQTAKIRGKELTLTRGPRKGDFIALVDLNVSNIDAVENVLSTKLGSRLSLLEKKWNRLSLLWRLSSLTLIIFILSETILLMASIFPFFAGEQAQWTTVYNSQQQAFARASPLERFVRLFSGNLQVSLLSFLPAIGSILLWWTIYNTGRFILTGALATGQTPLSVLLKLYQLPHGWVEYSTYGIAAAIGLRQVANLRSSLSTEGLVHRLKRPWLLYSLSFVVVALMIAGAAALEVLEPLFPDPRDPWVLVVPVVALAFLWVHHRKS